jgi:hypothetical protein
MSYEKSRHDGMVRRFLDSEKQIESRRLARRKDALGEFRSHAHKYLASLAMTMKSDQWKEEQEWRILVIQPEDGTRFQRLTRPDGVCYVELPICSPDIVRAVVLGPQCNSDPDDARNYLANIGFGSVSVRRVVLPV